MWQTRIEKLAQGRILKVAIDQQATPLRHSEVLRLWQDSDDFRGFFMAILSDAPFAAFRWETPPITASTAERPFEFVLLDSPGLAAAKPDPVPFQPQFTSKNAGESVVVFPNLGNDAILVVPRAMAQDEAYGHIAAFVRKAPVAQRHALWQAVGKAMTERLGHDPIWLSTAGAGVSWLHVRLDARPKYYGYAPYKALPNEALNWTR